MKKYHYTECGLDNIYLINGFEICNHADGNSEIFIHDIHGLHQTIGMLLVFKQGPLIGSEIKFIRTTLDLSQKALGKILGLDYQTILSWEKNKTNISKTADHLLKILFFSYLHKKNDGTIYDKINEIAALEDQTSKIKKIELQEIGHEWQLVA